MEMKQHPRLQKLRVKWRAGRCDQRQVTQYMPLLDGYATEQLAFQTCQHNILAAAFLRNYVDTPPIDEQFLARGAVLLDEMFRRNGNVASSVEVWTAAQVVASRTPAKKKIYARAFSSLSEEPLNMKRDAKVKTFVKFEVADYDSVQKKPPRAIQYRSSRFTAVLAKYIAPIEHALYQCVHNGLPIFAKTRTMEQRATIIVAMGGSGRTYICLDHSKYDAHQRKPRLLLARAFYLKYTTSRKALLKLLAKFLNNRVTSEGISWDAFDGRMSGEIDTACGNCVNNYADISAWLDLHGALGEAHMFIDGDDSVVSVPDRFVKALVENLAVDFKRLGLVTKIESIGKHPEEVSFCQTRPCKLDRGWCMCRGPFRMLSRISYTVQNVNKNGWKGYYNGVAVGHWHLGRGAPIAHVLGDSLVRDKFNAKAWVSREDREVAHYRSRSEGGDMPSLEARESYALGWGISVSEQLGIEEQIRRTNWSCMIRGSFGY